MAALTMSQRNAWVRRAVADAGIDPMVDTRSLTALIEESFRQFPPADEEERRAHATALKADIGGYGPLQRLLDDPTVEEVYLNSPTKIFAARQGQSELTALILTAEEVRDLVERMLHHSGRRLDLSVPFVDAMLPGGERLHVVIPPVAGQYWSVNIRKHTTQLLTLTELIRHEMLPATLGAVLSTAIAEGMTLVVSGATQAGKTTLARALAQQIPPRQRVITCEEVFELNLSNRDCVALQTRNANIEGVGAVTLRDLVRESLRMRPERIIIGEVRGAEALDMLLSLNAGIAGLTTVHANSAAQALTKLCLLPLLAGENVTSQFVVPTLAASVDLVVHVERNGQGKRRVKEVVYVPGSVRGEVVETTPIFTDEDGLARFHNLTGDSGHDRRLALLRGAWQQAGGTVVVS